MQFRWAEFLFNLFQPIELYLCIMIKELTLGYQFFAFEWESKGLT